MIYSTFWVGCPDCDLKSALDHATREIGNYSYLHVAVRWNTGTLASIWVKPNQISLQPYWRGGSHKK